MSLKIKVIALNARYSHSCLALFYLRNELEKHLDDCLVEICQYTINDPYYTMLQRISEGEADYYFFSALLWNSNLVTQMIKDLLTAATPIPVVVGGPQGPVVAEALGFAPGLTLFSGAIETADKAFYTDLAQKKLKPHYHASGAVAGATGLHYPYQRTDFTEHLNARAIYYESSRGCPFRCSYCLSSTQPPVYHKDLDQVFAELDDILSHSPPIVRFLDRTFNDNPQRCVRIWEYLGKHGGDTRFHFEIAPDRFTEEMFATLATISAGRFQFEMGVQSTNLPTLQAIGRPMEPLRAAEVISALRHLETIHLHVDLILGLPFETVECFKKSLNDVFAMQPHYIQLGLLKLLPSTRINQERQEHQYRAELSPPYGVLANRWLTESQLRQLYWLGACVEKCMNNRYFPTLWHYLLKIGEDGAEFFTRLAEQFYQQGYFWQATTQQTLSRVIQQLTRQRDDGEQIDELLRFDWLRCGHRFLPAHLEDGIVPLAEQRRRLFSQLPETWPGYYDSRTRKHFFKTSVFCSFSRETLAHIGYEVDAERPVVGFGAEREKTVLRLHVFTILAG